MDIGELGFDCDFWDQEVFRGKGCKYYVIRIG